MPGRRRDTSIDPFAAVGCTDVVPIGSGGASIVYRAYQPAFDRLIALKVLTAPLADERSRRRFAREVALAGRLTGHPNVVTVFASGFLPDGRGYVEMEYCPGGSLMDRVAQQGPLPARDVCSIGVKLAGVLELARLAGIVHRDVKPANVLVTRFGEPALSDFGIATIAGEVTGTTTSLTPVHAAPEVLESREVGPPADQWSLASTLYTLLAGRAPFSGAESEGMLAGMLRILSESVPAIPRTDVPGGLRLALERAMAKQPGSRWPNPAAFGEALQEVERTAGWPVTPLPVEEVTERRYGSFPAAVPPESPDAGWPPAPDTASTQEWRRRGAGVSEGVSEGAEAPTGVSGPPGEVAGAPAGVPGPSADVSGPPGAAPWAPDALAERPDRPTPEAGRADRAAPASGWPGPSDRLTPLAATGASSPPASLPPVSAPPAPDPTRQWVRRPTALPPTPPLEALPPGRSRRRLWMALGVVAAVVVAAVVVVIVSSSGGSGGRHAGTTVVTPGQVNQAARYAPQQVEVASEQGATVTLRWTDPNTGQFPYVVRVSGNPRLQVATGSTQTVVAGLTPGAPYCFQVGAVYAVGLVSWASPVCVNGGTPSTP